MSEGYFIINGYRERKEKVDEDKERIVIDLLTDGKYFASVPLDEGISEERYQRILSYLDETFSENDGTGAGALLTILAYIQDI